MKHIPEKAKEIVDEHIKIIESNLPGFLAAYYIYGSVSLGAFDYERSDIDFIAVVNRKAAKADINILKRIHGEMHGKFRRSVLDGMYLLKDDIKSLNNGEISCLRFNDGDFKGFSTFDRNSIDAFELKKYGITVKGEEIENLEYTVDFDILIDKMRDNLNTYWRDWVNDCRRFPSIKYIGLFFRLEEIEWMVLGVTRLYYSFRKKDIISKAGAGEYALQTVPQRWHRIIKESMRLRKNIKKSYYNSIFERRNDALGYMDYIMKVSNGLFEVKK